MTQQSKGTAVVTGASTGIGALYADRLARQGYDLVIVARNRARLDDLANRIGQETGRSVQVVTADLADRADLARVEELLRTDASVTLLVNNAGVGATAKLLDADIDKMEALIGLNVTALTRLTYAAVPRFVARGGGTIINISSIVAVAPELMNGVYGGSKAYVLAFSQSLRHELADKGVRVQAVLPGATATDLWELSGTPIQYLPKGIVMGAAAMVDASLAGLALGEFATVPSLPDIADWDAYEGARQRLMPNLSRETPAERYTVTAQGAA
ncbi:SDR family oxidoreductase [Solimonas sp. K1W22B-7]|uniref:SDR family NAD(P)-dependent oxidoreductase n=1 Tax=Solimonas sp. K1W22B-7 TaxID=2303331 RepID=UPI000E330F0E|nr:SDR family oxidoreductase [Solimonas sp. K1W22B-7]AXQ29590.1 SDR family oxidoreductase [Solimonas sp. K1W22B-7]